MDDEIPRAFVRWANSYLSRAGIDPQTVDIHAYYDRAISVNENQQIFREQFPIGEAKYVAGEAHEYEMAAARQQAGYTKEKQAAEEKKYKELQLEAAAGAETEAEMIYGKDKYTTQRFDVKKDIEQIDEEEDYLTAAEREVRAEEAARRPSLTERAKGFYKGAEEKYKEYTGKTKTKRMEREKELLERISEKRKEVEFKRLESEEKRLEKEIGRPSIVSTLTGGLLGGERKSGISSALGQRSSSSLSAGGTGMTFGGGMLSQMVYGTPQAQPGARKYKYRTIIEGGVARREKVPVGQAQQAQQAQPTGLWGMLGGGEKKPSLLEGGEKSAFWGGMLGGSNKKKEQGSGLLGMLGGSGKKAPGKESSFWGSMVGGGKKSGLSLSLGGSKGGLSLLSGKGLTGGMLSPRKKGR